MCKTRPSTGCRSPSRTSTPAWTSRSRTWRRASPADARAWTTWTLPWRTGEPRAVTSCASSTRTSWTRSEQAGGRRGAGLHGKLRAPRCWRSWWHGYPRHAPGSRAAPLREPQSARPRLDTGAGAQGELVGTDQAGPVVAADDRAGDRAAADLRLRTDGREHHRLAGLLALRRHRRLAVRRLGQLRAGVHQPAVPERGEEHA